MFVVLRNPKDKFRNAKGGRIPKSSIEHILKNIFYIGVFNFNGKIYENAKHKPIISKELYYSVQNRLIDPDKRKKRTFDLAYSGLIRCGFCGCQLVGEFKKNKYIYYHCTGNKGGECKKDYITQENIDKMIAEILKLIIIPVNVKKQISNSLKVNHEKKLKF